MRSKGRGVAITVATLGTFTLVGAGISVRAEILETWHIWRLGSTSFVAKFRAARRLGELRSQRAIPGLVALLRQSEHHQKEAAEVWGPQAGAPDRVASVLEEIGPAACVPAISVAMRESRDEKRYWRRRACRILEMSRASEAVPVLIDLAEDGYLCVRLHAVSSLGTFGPVAKDAIPILVRALDDRSVRQSAEHSLEAIRGPGTAAP